MLTIEHGISDSLGYGLCEIYTCNIVMTTKVRVGIVKENFCSAYCRQISVKVVPKNSPLPFQWAFIFIFRYMSLIWELLAEMCVLCVKNTLFLAFCIVVLFVIHIYYFKQCLCVYALNTPGHFSASWRSLFLHLFYEKKQSRNFPRDRSHITPILVIKMRWCERGIYYEYSNINRLRSNIGAWTWTRHGEQMMTLLPEAGISGRNK